MKTPVAIILIAFALVIVSTWQSWTTPARAAAMGGALQSPPYGMT